MTELPFQHPPVSVLHKVKAPLESAWGSNLHWSPYPSQFRMKKEACFILKKDDPFSFAFQGHPDFF
jgi:hypothetical protein